jgi:predicted aspartyl protease
MMQKHRKLTKIPVEINGITGNFLVLDIGAKQTTINEKFCKELYIEILEGSTEAITAHGLMDHKLGLLKDLKIFNRNFLNQIIRIGSCKLQSMFANPDTVLGVVGFDILKNFVVELDYKNQKFDVYEKYTKSTNGIKKIKFDFFNNYLISIPVTINNTFNYQFILDTGANGSLINKTVCDEIELHQLKSDNKIASPKGLSDASIVNIESIITPFHSFSNMKLVSFSLDHLNDGKKLLGGIFGMEFLENRIFIIDYPNQELLLIE